jgi:hypothetical protein
MPSTEVTISAVVPRSALWRARYRRNTRRGRGLARSSAGPAGIALANQVRPLLDSAGLSPETSSRLVFPDWGV